MACGSTSSTTTPALATSTVEYDHAARTLHLWIDDATTTASSLEAAFRENASVNNAWQFDHYLGSDGSGRLTRDTLVASDGWRQTVQGAAGGQVLSTAADVVTLINATPGLSDAFSAALVSGESGTGLVSPFEEYVHSGQAAAGNMLQFLGSAGARASTSSPAPASRSASIPSRTARLWATPAP